MVNPVNVAARWCNAAPLDAGDRLAGLAEAEAIWRLGPTGKPAPEGWIFGPGELAPGTGELISRMDADVIIADDLSRSGDDTCLRFKPAYDPLLLERFDYAGGAVFFREAVLDADARSAITSGAAPATFIRPGMRVGHLPYPAMILPAPVADMPAPTNRTPIGPITAIIPNRNSPDMIPLAVEAVLAEEETTLIIIDNGSDDRETLAYYDSLATNSRVLVNIHPAPFNFAAMVNRGAALARREFGEPAAFLLLNNDIEAPAPGWLRLMAETLAAPEVGIAGAKLLFPDRSIQHAGVIIGHGGVAGHELKGATEDIHAGGRMGVPHFREAVTAAAMLIRTELWDELGGFDYRAFAVAFNDVDFCLRADAAGWRVALDPRAVLIHHEGVSRRRPFALRRFLAHQRERTMLRLRHHTIGRIDRFESPWRDPENLIPTFRMLKKLPGVRF